MFPSLNALHKNGKYRTLQAMELESGVGRQWRLWKWASYCASEVNSTHSLEYASFCVF
jgi:nuclear pore complex protein Nup107